MVYKVIIGLVEITSKPVAISTMTDSDDIIVIKEDEKMDEQSEVLNSDQEPREEGKLLIHHILL